MTAGTETRGRELAEEVSPVTNRQWAVTGRFMPAMSELDRFWSQVDKDPVTGCWLWTGCVNDSFYPVFSVTIEPGVYRTVRAHRYAYERVAGPIEPGLTLDHLVPPDGPCTSRRCVNPAHLEPVSHGENARRARRRERILNGASA
jgi:hypothetical protein